MGIQQLLKSCDTAILPILPSNEHVGVIETSLSFITLCDGFALGLHGTVTFLVCFHQAVGGHDEAGHQRHNDQRAGQHANTVTPDELAQFVGHSWWPSLYRLAIKVSFDVSRQFSSGSVAPGPFLLERLHHNPVQITAH
jgi:hypothetical protein